MINKKLLILLSFCIISCEVNVDRNFFINTKWQADDGATIEFFDSICVIRNYNWDTMYTFDDYLRQKYRDSLYLYPSDFTGKWDFVIEKKCGLVIRSDIVLDDIYFDSLNYDKSIARLLFSEFSVRHEWRHYYMIQFFGDPDNYDVYKMNLIH